MDSDRIHPYLSRDSFLLIISRMVNFADNYLHAMSYQLRMQPQQRFSMKGLIIVFCVFFGFGCWLSYPTWNYGFTADDIHLIRSYSSEELSGVWHGPWDPDNIEFAGYRPLTTLFNHIRYEVFGESSLKQRIFLVSLLALYASLLVVFAGKLGVSNFYAIASGLIVIAIRNNFYLFTFISDGVHLLKGILIFSSVLFILSDIDRRSNVKIIFSVILFFTALLVREDTIALIPVMIFSVVLYGFHSKYYKSKRCIVMLTGLLVMTLMLLGARWLFVSTASFKINIFSIFKMFYYSTQFPGVMPPVPAGRLFILLRIWAISFGFILCLAAFVVDRSDRLNLFSLLSCAFILSSPGFIMARANLVLLPSSFIILFMVLTLQRFSESRKSRWYLSCCLLLITISTCAVTNRIAQQSFHPYSFDMLWGDREFIYGGHIDATIPPVRQSQIRAKLNALGIYNYQDGEIFLTPLEREAIILGRHSPNGNEPFVPRVRFFVP